MRTLIVVLLALILMIPGSVFAVPSYMSHSGRVIESNNVPVTGIVSTTFSIYLQLESGNSEWSETFDVAYENGYYSVVLGGQTSLESSLFENLADNETLYLGVAFESAEFGPRFEITSVPFAFMAGASSKIINSEGLWINNTQIVNSTGDWLGTPIGLDNDDLETYLTDNNYVTDSTALKPTSYDTESELPDASENTGGLAYVEDVSQIFYSNGTDWVTMFGQKPVWSTEGSLGEWSSEEDISVQVEVDPSTSEIALAPSYSFPEGLDISTDGTISGSTTEVGTHTFRLRAVGPEGLYSDSNIISITIKNIIIFNYTGNDQTFTVPEGITSLDVRVWGAGGGGSGANNYGGPGGFSKGIVECSPSDQFTVVVGGGGKSNNGSNTPWPATYGGGGLGTASGNVSGSGGGLSGIFEGSSAIFSGAAPQSEAHSKAIIIAGGGGGANDQDPGTAFGGSGGGLSGIRGASKDLNDLDLKYGQGGTQTQGGGHQGCTTPPNSGSALRGADGVTGDNAGGGSGYFGGGGGCDDHTGGGGGSGYIGGTGQHPVSDGVTQAQDRIDGGEMCEAGLSDPFYESYAGRGGYATPSSTGYDAGHGRVVIIY